MKNNTYIGKDLKRRDFLKFGGVSLAALSLPRLLASRAFAKEGPLSVAAEAAASASAKKLTPKAKCIIQIWLNGGPCHIDTFDPKPEASRDIVGRYDKPISTNVEGIQLAQKFENLAKCADKYSILRGINHNVFAHETATYLMQTGIPVGGELVYPNMASVISTVRGPNQGSSVPSYITVPNPLGRFEESGFLGANSKSFAASGVVSGRDWQIPTAMGKDEKAKQAEKNAQKLLEKENLRIANKKELLAAIDNVDKSLSPEIENMDSFRQQAYSVMFGAGREAFDLSKESVEMRKKYGESSQAQQVLLARRLAEAGASYVLVNWGGWDTHKKHFEAMERLLSPLDKALSALIEDLSERGMLDSTLVMCGGEFSRTPRVMYNPPWFGGRNHYGDAGAWIVAGGGFVGGQVVGATDKNGFKVVERPIYPWDLSASIYKLAGIDSNAHLPHPLGCSAYITPPEIRIKPSGGILTEIMKA